LNVAFLSLRAGEPLAFGLMSLAAALREHGHRVVVVDGLGPMELAAEPEVRSADVLAFSATTGLHRLYVQWATHLRKRFPDKAIVMGGPHPTFFPEVIEQAPFDGVCIGEGEESFPEFLHAWETGFGSVPRGWWVRRNTRHGPVERGEPRCPVLDLDQLPLPAYDLFYGDGAPDRAAQRRVDNDPIRVFLPTRGCPYRCTYCFNRTLNERYRPYGAVLRARDPELAVDDIQAVNRRWGGKMTWLVDANVVAHHRWLEAFLPIYRRRIGRPFFCKLRPEQATERTVRLLVEGGCTAVGVGIESGSEQLRRTVLGRRVSDAAILAGCRRMKSKGLRVMSFNMLGIPGETLDDALRTIALNAACRVDYGGATILQPYPGTALAKWAVDHEYFSGDFESLSYSYFAESPLRFERQRDRDRITNLQRLFAYAVEFPEVRRSLRWLIDRPPNAVYRYLFEGRHMWALRHTFHRAFARDPGIDAGSPEELWQGCRQLGIAPDA